MFSTKLFALAAGGFLFAGFPGCSRAEEHVDQPAKDQKPTMIVVRSVLPPDLKDSAKRLFVLQYGLTLSDFDFLKTLEGVKHLAPLHLSSQEVQHQQKTYDARLVATTEAYASVNRLEMVTGRFLHDKKDQQDNGDDERSRNVIVLGTGVAEALFPFENAVGKTVVLHKRTYEVVGVIKERLPQKVVGQAEEDFNKDVYIPLATVRAGFGFIRGKGTPEQVELHQIIITVAESERLEALAEVIRDMLKNRHKQHDWEVTVR